MGARWLSHRLADMSRLRATLLFLTAPVGAGWSNPCSDESVRSFPFCDRDLDLEARVNDYVTRISAADKVGLFRNGALAAPSVNVPAYQWWNEALHGVGHSPGVSFSGETPCATSFPQVQTTSMSYNKTLWGLVGQAIGTEGRAFSNYGNAGLTFWTPNINIFRDPRWGRGQETPGEDPKINSDYAVNFVRGFQGNDTKYLRASTCCKHFAAYSLEDSDGVNRHRFNAIVSQQDLTDTYYPAFEACVGPGGASGVMCSYNAVNGVPSCANPEFLTTLLREKWGFNGYVTSDCGAVTNVMFQHNYTSSIGETINVTLSAGMDTDCGPFLNPHSVNGSLKDGYVSTETVDTALRNQARVQMRLGYFDADEFQPYKKLDKSDINSARHQQLALEAARQGITLLKNRGKNMLPLDESVGTIALVGPHADATKVLLGNYFGEPPYTISPKTGLEKYSNVTVAAGCKNVACASDAGFGEAVDAAKTAEAVVIICGIDQTIERESRDRTDITLPGQQQKLITQVADAAADKPVALVLFGGGSLDLAFARDSDSVSAILWAGYPGQSGGQALAEVLFGDVNPSGKLTQTIYPSDFVTNVKMTNMSKFCASFLSFRTRTLCGETPNTPSPPSKSITDMRPDETTGFPGRTYRFYQGDPVYEFGHGLSYTTYSSTWTVPPPAQVRVGAMRRLLRSATSMSSPNVPETCVSVANTGNVAGAQTVLVFAVPPSAGTRGRPRKTLIEFDRVWLEPGEPREISFQIRAHHLAVAADRGVAWEPVVGQWGIQVTGGLTASIQVA